MLGDIEVKALSFHQLWGTRLASLLLSKFSGVSVTDLGPFRAIRFSCYQQLDMHDKNFGWTVEMQVKAIKRGFHVIELPVTALVGASASHVSGNISGALFASFKILYFIFSHMFCQKLMSR